MPDRKLKRKLGLFPAANIVVANIIGAGIFTTSGLLMAELKSPLLMLLLWIAGGCIALCGAISYSELGAAMPASGGEYIFLSRLYHPLIGFLSGWVSLTVGFSAPIAASAIGFSEYFSRAIPLFDSVLSQKLLSIAVIILFTAIHFRGVEFGSKVQNYLTILKVLLIVGLITVGFLAGDGEMGNLSGGSALDADFGGWKTIGLSLMWIMFAYSGWNASTYIGSEIKNPSRNLPGSLIIGTGLVILLYLGLNILFVYAIPPAEMEGVISVGGLAMNNLFGPSADVVFSLLISFALFSSLSAFIIIGPRVYYSMAEDGLLFRSVARIHPRFGVPSTAILLQGAIAIILTLSGTFEQILTYMGFALGIFPLLSVIGVIKIRMAGTSKLRLPGYPFVQLLFVAVSVFILVLALLERPLESSIAIFTVLAGIPVYFLFRRNSRNSP
ncbi:MAG: amino acid permease [Acidobacteriota bacterium]